MTGDQKIPEAVVRKMLTLLHNGYGVVSGYRDRHIGYDHGAEPYELDGWLAAVSKVVNEAYGTDGFTSAPSKTNGIIKALVG